MSSNLGAGEEQSQSKSGSFLRSFISGLFRILVCRCHVLTDTAPAFDISDSNASQKQGREENPISDGTTQPANDDEVIIRPILQDTIPMLAVSDSKSYPLSGKLVRSTESPLIPKSEIPFESMDIWGCQGEQHQCGKMIVRNTILPRCEVYKKDYELAVKRGTSYLDWWKVIRPGPPISTTSSQSAPYARPRSCIRGGRLIDSIATSDPYIAVSYVWDTNPSFVKWQGRDVTTQALDIAEQLSKHTSYALWIDAICIPQNDNPVKQVELKKMADIYRGASAVLCLVPEVDPTTCITVERAAALMDMEGFCTLEDAGDTHGMYMFASQGSNEALCKLFGSRWWSRAWTFQEAVLNNATFIVGKKMETIPISDVLKLCGPIARRAATQRKDVLGQSSAIWDSMNSMKMAITDPMPLGEAMSNVWRRNCTVTHDMAYSLLGVCHLQEVQPDYSLPLDEVFTDLVEKATSKGDFSWLRWTHVIDRSGSNRRMSMVPVPATIKATPASAITAWRSVKLPQVSSPVRGDLGVPVPHRSTGVIRWQSDAQGIKDTIKTLQNMSYSPEEIWNLLFGMHVGLAPDIDRAAGGSGLAQPLLSLTSGYIDGTIDPSSSTDDMVGEKPYTRGYGFTSYASMAAKVWKEDTHLRVMQSQGGTTVVPEVTGSGRARIHKLPLESHSARSTCLCIVVHDNARYQVSAVGVMVEKEHAGSGAWQLTRFS